MIGTLGQKVNLAPPILRTGVMLGFVRQIYFWAIFNRPQK